MKYLVLTTVGTIVGKQQNNVGTVVINQDAVENTVDTYELQKRHAT